MSKKGELRCSCGRKLVYTRMDGSGRCHICGDITKEEVLRQKKDWNEQKDIENNA